MNRRKFLHFSFISTMMTAFMPPINIPRVKTSSKSSGKRANVLFIAVDDLNDWISLYNGPIRMPNLERLAKKGLTFTNAYCASPACNPSRASLMTGFRPSTTGIYGNATDWRKALPDAVTLPQHFMNHGYWAEGAGKIFHHHYHNAFHDDASFHRFFKLREDPWPERKLNRITNWIGGRDGGPTSQPFDWGPWPNDIELTPDAQTVDYTIRFLGEKHNRPFFFAAGIFRPHSPWYAPMEYFKQYPLKKLVMPEIFDEDLNDLPSGAIKVLAEGKPFIYKTIAGNNQLKAAIQAYQACATFADDQIGRILISLDDSPYKNNTIIVLWSDNGFHLGEKKHWEKFALWEKSTRVPLIICAPGVTGPGSVCTTPVSLIDLYPTLVELCDLNPRTALEGVSLVPLLKNPQADWDRPAVMTYGRGNHAVKSRRWRYIRYSDGSEELYDHDADANEWHNLANKPELQNTIDELKKWLPEKNAIPAADMEPWHGEFKY
ncbi:sulfatase [candidate division KSB1 bacterium]|nr:sulfatase [candidate division KSB1 bacterium]